MISCNRKFRLSLWLSLLMTALVSAQAKKEEADGNVPAGSSSSQDAETLKRLAEEYMRASKSGLVPQLQTRNARYRLRKGDVLSITFPHVPALDQTVTVQPDGYVTLKLIGDLHVENLTVPEVTSLLQIDYSRPLREPVISVELKEFERPYFLAAGEVGQPGKYDLRGQLTVAQAIAIAGGFTESAKHSQVIVFRAASNDWVEARQVNLKKMLEKRDLSEDIQLQPGDLLFVPKSGLGKLRIFLPKLSLGPQVRPF